MAEFARYGLLEALIGRRSRRFAPGMHLDGGPLSYESTRTPTPLTLDQQAALAFAACGITGPALAELPYESGATPESGGGHIMMNLVGRTGASGDAAHVNTVFVIDDDGVWLLRRPQDYDRAQIPELIELAHAGKLTELYEKARVRIADSRADIPHDLRYMLPLNKWSANRPGTTYFLPFAELSAFYINITLSLFDEEFSSFVVDDRNNFRPAGVGGFARSKGGHLIDDPREQRTQTIGTLESMLLEFAAIEAGGIHQNLGLMTQALGLGGFPHFAAHPWIWAQALGFRTVDLPLSRVAGMSLPLRLLTRALRKDVLLPTPIGLERGGEVLIKPFCPPYYPDMTAAVHAFVDAKYAAGSGTFRNAEGVTAWLDPAAVEAGIPSYSARTIEAACAYCTYVYERYGRFPSVSGPFRNTLAYQASRLDPDFYKRFYRPDALTDTQRAPG